MTIYKCHNWAFNPKNQELIYSDGQVKQLPGRINLCLKTLLESRGETVPYEQLLMQVWGTTHKDPSTISSVISELRKLIGCGRDKVKLLATIPKRGYRFVGEVEVLNDKQLQDQYGKKTAQVTIAEQLCPTNTAIESTQSPTKPSDAMPSSRYNLSLGWSKSVMMLMLGFLIAVSASILSANLIFSDPDDYLSETKVFSDHEVLTHEQGIELEFDVGRDGKWLIYVADQGENQFRIVAKDLDSGERFTLPFEPENHYRSPSFSPDMTQVVYLKDSPRACEIWLIDFAQGQFDKDSARRVSRCGLSGFWTTTDFSADGKSVYFSRSESLHDPFRIYRHDLQTGYERNVTAPTSSGRGDYAFGVSPNGKLLAIIRNKMWQASRILVKNLEDDSITSVDEVPELLQGVQWLSDTQLVYGGGGWQVNLYNLVEQRKKVVAKLNQPLTYPLARNGRLYGYRGFDQDSAIWSLTDNSDGELEINSLLDSPYVDSMPVLASSNKLFFMSNRSGRKQLWYKEGQRYSELSASAFPERVKMLHYSESFNALFGVSQEKIFRFDLQLEQLTWLTDENEKIRNLSLSDDDRLIYAVDLGEQWQLRMLELATENLVSLDVNGFTAHLQDDQLYFTKYREKGLWKMDMKSQQARLLINDFEALATNYWDVLGEKIYLYVTDKEVFHVYSSDSGQPLSQNFPAQGSVKDLKCYVSLGGCLFDLYVDGETEIVVVK